ncbi:MAG: cyclic nucleotide-binding domain-containing protein, partial [Candidatus Zixiibacteriota bacterium]
MIVLVSGCVCLTTHRFAFAAPVSVISLRSGKGILMSTPPRTDRFLAAFRTFRAAPEALVREICTASHHLSFSPGDVLYREGDACPGVALFLDGEVRVYKVAESGREITLYEIGPGETCVLNASCILAEQQYPAHAAAITAGELLMLPSAVFQKLLADYPEMRRFIYGFFSRRLANIMELV